MSAGFANAGQYREVKLDGLHADQFFEHVLAQSGDPQCLRMIRGFVSEAVAFVINYTPGPVSAF